VRFAVRSLRGKFALALLGSAPVPLTVFAAVNYFRTSAGLTGIENRVVATSATAVTSGLAQQQAAGIAPLTVSTAFVDADSGGDRQALKVTAWNILQTRNLVQVEVGAAVRPAHRRRPQRPQLCRLPRRTLGDLLGAGHGGGPQRPTGGDRRRRDPDQ
jgi:hypothetical protein